MDINATLDRDEDTKSFNAGFTPGDIIFET